MKKEIPFFIIIFSFLPIVVFGASFDRDLYYGISSDHDVTRLQEFLTDQGVYSGPVTGNFFTLTQNGVKRFQEREGITPVFGYFGPKTRVRANELLSSATPPIVSESSDKSRDELIAFLVKQIEELQAELAALLSQEPPSGDTPIVEEPSVSDITPPVFVKAPTLVAAEFLSEIIDPRHVYKVAIEWSFDEDGVTESVRCTPSMEPSELGSGRVEYLPEADTDYSCTVAIADAVGNESAEIVRFSTPSWLGIVGDAEQEFPPIEKTPLKLGELTFYNGSSTDILLSRFQVDIIDEMDSVRNRNRKVYFTFKDGTDILDAQISKNPFTFVLVGPKVGDPHKSRVDNFSFPVLVKAGEEKTVSFWVELLEYVRSGSLEVKLVKVRASSDITPTVGTFSFRLTKEPPL